MEMIGGEKVATNPTTGAKVVLRGGSWQPYTPQSLGSKIVGLGKQAEAGYESVAKPATTALAKGLSAAERTILPKLGAPGVMAAGILGAPADSDIPSPQAQAQFVVPQTIPQAAITAGSFALPGAKEAQGIGDAAGPLTRALGTRVGRIAGLGAIGAGAGALTGEGAGSGAAQGLAAAVPGELGSMAYGMAGRRLGLGSFERGTTKQFGQTVTEIIPWIGKLKTGGEIEDQFVRGGATLKAAQRLSRLNDHIANHPKVQGQTFNVPAITPNGVHAIPMPFRDADSMVHRMNQEAFLHSGAERGSPASHDWRALSHEVRDRIAAQLNKLQKGMGDAYLKEKRNYGTAQALSHVLSEPGVLGLNGIDQPAMIKALLKPKYQHELRRTLGKENTDRLLDTLRRGYQGSGTDVYAKKGYAGVSATPFGGHAFVKPGHTYKAMGDVPSYMRPSGRIADATAAGIERANQDEPSGPALVHTPGGEPWNQPGAGTKSLKKSQAEHLAPTASASDRAEKVSTDLSKGKNPEVHKDLGRGRLSMDEIDKLLKVGARKDAMAMLEHVPLTEAMDAAEVATPAERAMLMPLIQQKMQSQFKDQKYNKTLAVNLAKRFKALQTGGTNADIG